MRNVEASQRYAKALYSLSVDKNNVDGVLNELREFSQAILKDEQLSSFFNTPINAAQEKAKVLTGLFEKKPFTEEVKGLLLLLVNKRRFALLEGIAHEFQAVVDVARGIARGHVYSASTLVPEERNRIEATISKYTAKKAVLEYHEDKKLLGGLVAQVGSYTFDDSLETQLRLVKESLTKRRSN